jgi:hypothetical protein
MQTPSKRPKTDNKRAGPILETWGCRWKEAQQCWLVPPEPKKPATQAQQAQISLSPRDHNLNRKYN